MTCAAFSILIEARLVSGLAAAASQHKLHALCTACRPVACVVIGPLSIVASVYVCARNGSSPCTASWLVWRGSQQLVMRVLFAHSRFIACSVAKRAALRGT
jgi:hypothetical protein